MRADEAAQRLTRILARRDGIIPDPNRLDALLRDYFPGERGYVEVLLSALREGIPGRLRSDTGTPRQVLRTNLERLLHSRSRIDTEISGMGGFGVGGGAWHRSRDADAAAEADAAIAKPDAAIEPNAAASACRDCRRAWPVTNPRDGDPAGTACRRCRGIGSAWSRFGALAGRRARHRRRRMGASASYEKEASKVRKVIQNALT